MTMTEQAKGRFMAMALLAGGLLGIPAGWLLAYLAALPVFLGLFFFLLVGLIIGATMYRVGRPGIPMPPAACWLAGACVAVLTWGTGIYAEYRWFPDHAAAQVVAESVTEDVAAEDRLRAESRARALQQLASEYPPGGLIGYVAWAARDGTMILPKVPEGTPLTYRLADRRTKWIVRAVLSLMFLFFSIVSQVLGLARAPETETDAEPQPPATPTATST